MKSSVSKKYGSRSLDSSDHYKTLAEMLLESSPSSVVLISHDFRIVLANKNFLKKNKISTQEVINQKIEKIFPPSIVEQMDIKNSVRKVFEQSEPFKGGAIHYRAPGLPIRFYYYRFLPFTHNKKVENAMLLMEDITEQTKLSDEVRRVERHLSGLVESAQDIILSTSISGEIQSWNNFAEQITSYKREHVIGNHFSVFCQDLYKKEIGEVFDGLKITGGLIKKEWPLRTKKNEVIPVYWLWSTLQDEKNRTTGFVGIGRDLSDWRLLEQKLVRSEKLNALGVMAGGIAHEIRNPLAVCSSANQFFLDADLKDPFLIDCSQKIEKNIQKISDIITTLLRLAREPKSIEKKPVDLNLIIEETLALVDEQANQKDITINRRFLDNPVFINGEQSLLQHVFINLFFNAINAMANGGKLIIHTKETGNKATVEVSDNGAGIPEADIDKIFDPFYTTAPTGKGSGLGLSKLTIATLGFGLN